MGEFIATLDPMWVLLMFPLLLGSIALGCWRDYLKQEKLKAHPERMDADEYRRYNRERFNGK
jgi:hypothetical protein